MGAPAITGGYRSKPLAEGKWINSQGWDLTFISLGVVLVTIP